MLQERTRVSFASDLSAHGDRAALISPGGAQLSYRELDDRVAQVAGVLGDERRLVLLAATNDVDSVVAYLAALRGGHPVLLAGAEHVETLTAAYDPDVVCRGGRVVQRRSGTAHDLHEELALLLSTSGSTGSPKLVRLSAENVASNAEAIAEYLDIRDTDRALLSLPLHYCYGLSILNSNLSRGAAVALSDRSVVEPEFWTLARAVGATSLHGVPHTFELIDRVGLPELPSLRYVTQAGGRLAPEHVRRYARLGQQRGWRLFVMYGQTEATARMAYLPPELAATRPSAIGRPVPGGEFAIRGGGDEGELVYRGANVMLGYATGPADLALGRVVQELETGDVVRRASDGLYEVVGRTSRFVKPFGLRVDLDRIERILGSHGHEVACTGDDQGLLVATTAQPDRVRELVVRVSGLPASGVRVVELAELPRLFNGKLDYTGIPVASDTQPREQSVRALFCEVLHLADVEDDATFVSLGGDSMSYVQMSIRLERLLGELPANWHTTAISDLEATTGRGGAPTVETNILLRALAIVLIVGSHIGVYHVLGGAHLLLAIAGWSFARFGLSSVDAGGAVLRSAARIAVPAVAWISWRSAVRDDVVTSNVLLVNNYLHHGTWGYWYVEVLVQLLLLLGALFLIPAVRRAERRHRFAFALGAVLVALVAHLFAHDTAEFPERALSTHGVAWFFALGWLAHRSATTRQRLLTAALALAVIPGYFDDPVREAVIMCGFLLLLFVPRVVAPRAVLRVVAVIASASLYIYLSHWAIYLPLVDLGVPYVPVLLACLAGGTLLWRVAQRGEGYVRAFMRDRRARLRRRPGPLAHQAPAVCSHR
ncbi:AMP-binding protein [Lentzea nigeriaca]|uniref:AMP-binding protein n=1 Tax=Lentzea nigeriaca TaxID=1128665 RepID=UPI0027DD7401|nr:AMP-binding protein [Lentzea nigeriaca]MBM7864591.1 acyl-coenzyme A synthetase/AMP-(fatty) acid ligase/peptidoglycan/LPS O-acetylase OafA/YrhL [Lentzea nigeriaca]